MKHSSFSHSCFLKNGVLTSIIPNFFFIIFTRPLLVLKLLKHLCFLDNFFFFNQLLPSFILKLDLVFIFFRICCEIINNFLGFNTISTIKQSRLLYFCLVPQFYSFPDDALILANFFDVFQVFNALKSPSSFEFIHALLLLSKIQLRLFINTWYQNRDSDLIFPPLFIVGLHSKPSCFPNSQLQQS